MKKVIFNKDTRGFTNHEWLKTYHTFSFGNYYDENRMGFGNLRVLNDDFIQPRNGFGTHTHDNIEIITIPLEGTIRHKDNLGKDCHLKFGDVQVLSTGSGLTHSQVNPSGSEISNFLQLWILPDRFNTSPASTVINYSLKPGKLIFIASQDGKKNTLSVQQKANLYLGSFSSGSQVGFTRSSEDNGIFVLVIQGKIKTEGEVLSGRDAVGLSNHRETNLEILENSFLMLLDISMVKKQIKG